MHMLATDLLEHQHREVEKLFKEIEKAKDKRQKTRLFSELLSSLVAHDAIEREVFYPACQEKLGMTDLLGEALVEHGLVEFSLYQADRALGDDDFDFKVQVLSEVVSHHVEEEEKALFRKVKKALGKELLTELGAKMEAKFEEAKKADCRAMLLDNLRQALAGALETKKPAPKRDPNNGSREGKRTSAVKAQASKSAN
jgi:hemerythrin superfamily protein